MKAVICERYGPPDSLVLADVPSPVPGKGEVVVAVHAASLNFPDLLIIENKYQTKPALPFSPGTEAAGVVAAVGEEVTSVRPGDRVMAYTRYGAFAEEVKTDAWRVLPIPDDMDDVHAAAFLVTYGTAYHALVDRAGLTPHEVVLVLGAAGGVGLAGIEVAKALGARVIACASSDEKLEVCRAHGADLTINYTRDDFRFQIAQLTDGRGADVVYDPVGGPYTEPALRSIAWRGRVLVIGFAAGQIPRIALNLPLLKGCAIVGVYWGDFVHRERAAAIASVSTLVKWFRERRLKPHISATFPLERAADALNLMASRQAIGKIVLSIGAAR